jgi:glycosyltransferase involved in cell wall biosynthesis
MKLSVIVSTYNREKYLPNALESLANQTFEPKKFEIILINNNSSDSTESICNSFAEKYPNLNFRYIIEYNQGLSYARNRGIDESKGDILVFIDDDAFAFNNYLHEIDRFFVENKQIIAGGGRIYPKWEYKQPIWMSKYLLPLVSVIDLGDEVKLFKNRNFPIGANMAFRRKAFEKYGKFNVNLGRIGSGMQGGEEKDIFYRLQKAGEQIAYIPNAKVHHLVPQKRLSFDFIKKQAIEIGKSEKIRAKSISFFEIFTSFLRELFKWGASLIIYLYFFYTFKIEKAKMIIRFRIWVSKGLFFTKI